MPEPDRKLRYHLVLLSHRSFPGSSAFAISQSNYPFRRQSNARALEERNIAKV
jgi:hypothetical protein